jgi:hypothetical protein
MLLFLFQVDLTRHMRLQDVQLSRRWVRPLPFTPAQYEELEQQALIYKYLVAGVPMLPDLIFPIRRSLDSLATRFYGHPTRTPSTLLPVPPLPLDAILHISLLACASCSTLRRTPRTLCYSDQVYFPSFVKFLRSFLTTCP